MLDLYGDSRENLSQILALVIIISLISSVRGLDEQYVVRRTKAELVIFRR